MEQMEALWAFMQEDMKADRIADSIRRSPLRQNLEKTRDFILEQQKAYKQIEEQVSVNTDRKDAIRDAIQRSGEQLKALEEKFKTNPPTDAESAQAMIADVEKCRGTVAAYEKEMRKMSHATSDMEGRAASMRRRAATAKAEFDQMKVQYDKESKEKKAELEAQRGVAAGMQQGIPEELMARYSAVKKHVVPPLARLVGGQCSGCNTSLPSATLRKLESGEATIECETCGRLLIK